MCQVYFCTLLPTHVVDCHVLFSEEFFECESLLFIFSSNKGKSLSADELSTQSSSDSSPSPNEVINLETESNVHVCVIKCTDGV